MPRYMLDTNMCIHLMKNQPAEVARRFSQCYVGDVVMSAITLAELRCGVAVSADPAREQANLDDLIEDIPAVPFDARAAMASGPIRLASRESNKNPLDQLMAAHAVALDVTVVTNNIKGFARYPGVKTDNWLMPAEPEN